MEKPFHLMAGIVAALAVVVVLSLSIMAPKETKKSISESIPHGANEKPGTK